MKIYESFADIAERKPEAFFSESETTTRQQRYMRKEVFVLNQHNLFCYTQFLFREGLNLCLILSGL